MKSTTTYLHFNGNCRTAMAFYRECFGGELEVMAYPDASGKPNTDPKAPVQHSMIAQGSQALLMASDYPPGPGILILNDLSLHLKCGATPRTYGKHTGSDRSGLLGLQPAGYRGRTRGNE
ncbi:MAG: hypothetical protein WA324_29050 [Bryobacteraceae bacterium]